jgi:predicted DNA-binding protein
MTKRTRLTIDLPAPFKDQLNQISAKHGVTKAVMIRKAIEFLKSIDAFDVGERFTAIGQATSPDGNRVLVHVTADLLE